MTYEDVPLFAAKGKLFYYSLTQAFLWLSPYPLQLPSCCFFVHQVDYNFSFSDPSGSSPELLLKQQRRQGEKTTESPHQVLESHKDEIVSIVLRLYLAPLCSPGGALKKSPTIEAYLGARATLALRAKLRLAYHHLNLSRFTCCCCCYCCCWQAELVMANRSRWPMCEPLQRGARGDCAKERSWQPDSGTTLDHTDGCLLAEAQWRHLRLPSERWSVNNGRTPLGAKWLQESKFSLWLIEDRRDALGHHRWKSKQRVT